MHADRYPLVAGEKMGNRVIPEKGEGRGKKERGKEEGKERKEERKRKKRMKEEGDDQLVTER